ncbi:MAG: hypothetical protein IJ890_08330 [Clostridia bacterium]|nr:hypothetical protein [Clostridia bacterium]
MSVGTNENNKINENINDFKLIKNAENTGGKVIDMEATQRIDFIDELIKDSKKTAKKIINEQQGTFAPQNEEKEIINENKIEEINVQNSSSEKSTEPIAQAENSSVNNISCETVQKTPNEINKQNDNQNTQTENIINENEIENNKENAEKIEENKEQTSEEIIKKKEKQHAQDKKDYRLERMLFDRINKMQGKIKESLELIKKFERINAKEENLPNIVTTLHDKLTHEVIKQFRTVGIEFNMKSYLVQSIVSDLLNKFEEGISEFKDCSENLNFVREVQEDFESRVELAPTSRVKTIFARIRGIFKPERKQERLEELERERQEKKLQEANIHLIKYKFINSELQKYTIRKNIVGSLTREILYGQGSGMTLNVNDFVEQKISPEMKQLGLEHLIPELEKNVFEEYKIKNDEITKEEFEKMSVGEIRKNIKFQKADILRKKISTVVASNESGQEKMVV